MIKIGIIYNTEKENAIEIYEEIKEYLKNLNKFEILEETNFYKIEYLIIIGGDGTLLRSFKILKNKKIKVIAINSGTLGYLTEIRKDKYKEIIENILKNKVNIENRHYLKIKINNVSYSALNEVLLTRENIKRNILSSEIYVDNKFLGKFKGDGVIISTPTGSTAYSLSAGGPIITPELKVFLITPIAPHNLNTRPIIISGELKIILKLSNQNEAAFLNIDGHTHKKIKVDDKIEITYAKDSLRVVIPEARNYYDVLREKLKWGENLC